MTQHGDGNYLLWIFQIVLSLNFLPACGNKSEIKNDRTKAVQTDLLNPIQLNGGFCEAHNHSTENRHRFDLVDRLITPKPERARGVKKIAIIRVIDINNPAVPNQCAKTVNLKNVIEDVNNVLKKTSYNLLSLNPTYFDAKVAIPNRNQLLEKCDRNAWADYGRAELTRNGVDLDSFDLLSFVMPELSCSSTGGGKVSHITQCGNQAVFVHEIGHNLGLGHAASIGNASYINCLSFDPPFKDKREWREYGDTAVAMGTGEANKPKKEYNAINRLYLGWIPESKVEEVNQSGIRTISTFGVSSLDDANDNLILKVCGNSPSPYYISYRADHNLQNCSPKKLVSIHTVPSFSKKYTLLHKHMIFPNFQNPSNTVDIHPYIVDSKKNVIDNGLSSPPLFTVKLINADEKSAMLDIEIHGGCEEGNKVEPSLDMAPSFQNGKSIDVKFANSQGGTQDWIGIYKKGETIQTEFITWLGIPAGQKEGSLKFDFSKALAAGDYEARLFFNNNYNEVASIDFTIEENIDLINDPQLEAIVKQNGASIDIKFTDVQGGTQNWIGVYNKAENNHRNFITWLWIPAGQTKSSLNFKFDKPLADGEYQARLFYNNSYKLETEVDFTIVKEDVSPPSNPSIKMKKLVFGSNENIGVRYFDLPNKTPIWVGIYKFSQQDNQKHVGKMYIPDDSTQGTLNFNLNLTRGIYEARLFFNDSYVKEHAVRFYIFD